MTAPERPAPPEPPATPELTPAQMAALAPWLAAMGMAALFGGVTARVGWVAVPVLAFAAGMATAWVGPRLRASAIGGAAVLGWGLLLLLSLGEPNAGAVPRLFGALTQLGPAAGTGVALLLTFALGFVLAWSAAVLGQAGVGLARRRAVGVEPAPGIVAPPAVSLPENSPPAVAPPGAVTLPPRHAAPAPAARPAADPP